MPSAQTRPNTRRLTIGSRQYTNVILIGLTTDRIGNVVALWHRNVPPQKRTFVAKNRSWRKMVRKWVLDHANTTAPKNMRRSSRKQMDGHIVSPTLVEEFGFLGGGWRYYCWLWAEPQIERVDPTYCSLGSQTLFLWFEFLSIHVWTISALATPADDTRRSKHRD